MQFGSRRLPSGRRPAIVGVVNLSPESPNQDAVVDGAAAAVARASALAAAGADLIDIGGRSSHFAALDVPAAEEWARLQPALSGLLATGFLVSVDTWDAGVAALAVAAGAQMINDSDGFQGAAMIEVLAGCRVPVVVPYLNGPTPRDLGPIDDADPVSAMLRFFERALSRAERAGVAVERLILDPGTGYAQPHLSPVEKEVWQRRVYPDLPRLRALGRPLFVALPRKAQRSTTVELARMIIDAGVEFVRAHDPSVVAEALVPDGTVTG